jgi:Xaa-Pro aminopeptidase
VPNVLIYADTVRSPELRHELPVGVPDPFLYAEVDGVRHVVVSQMEIPRLAALGIPLELHPPEDLGYDDLVAKGLDYHEIRLEISARFCEAHGVTEATVPDTFPLAQAERLREAGVTLRVDRDFFAERRRSKTPAELEGIRRAQRAADAGMAAAAELIGRASASNGVAVVDGEPLTSERIKQAIALAFLANGATSDEYIVAHGPQSAIGHHMGTGPIAPGEPIVIDIWPRDNESACYADMTRTFVVGQPPNELVDWHRLTKEALDRAVAEIRPGARGRTVYDASCDVYERAGFATQRTKEPGVPLDHGFYHVLGHGVGLEVHEAPGMGRLANKTLVAGDVVTVEPGLYRAGYGGVRLEDIVLVTESGAEVITDYPYDLEP